MSDFDKKFVIREAENILEEFRKKDKEEKNQLINLKNNLKKVKKTNIILKIIIALMAIGIIMMAV